MTRRHRTEIHRWDEVPTFADEHEEAAFWAAHSLGRELLATMGAPPPGLLPPARPRPVARQPARRTGAAVIVIGSSHNHQPARRVFDFQRYGVAAKRRPRGN